MPTELPNLTAIRWAHAVNSRAVLRAALKSDVNMIEADIVLGKVGNNGPDIPVMAHPPQITSDISLDDFLQLITDYNSSYPNAMKGIKLDFKSIEVFEGSLNILEEHLPLMTCAVWLNADIICGPVNETRTKPVDADRFIAGCAKYENAVLSIGWTTCWGPHFSKGSYSNDQIGEMVKVIQKNKDSNSKQKITFPIRAGIAAQSVMQFYDLLREVGNSYETSLTIWSSPNDNVDIDKLRDLISFFGNDRVYLDVPDEIIRQLNLNNKVLKNNISPVPSLINFGFISFCLLLTSLIMKKH